MEIVEISFKEDDRSAPIRHYNLKYLQSIFSYFENKEHCDGGKCDLTQFTPEPMEHLLFISDPGLFIQFADRYANNDRISMELIMSYADTLNLAVFLKAKPSLVLKIMLSIDVDCDRGSPCDGCDLKQFFARFLSLLFPYEELKDIEPPSEQQNLEGNVQYAIVMLVLSIKMENPLKMIKNVLSYRWISVVFTNPGLTAEQAMKHKFAFTILEQAMLLERYTVQHWKPVNEIIRKSLSHRLSSPHWNLYRLYDVDNPFSERSPQNDEIIWGYIRFSWIRVILYSDDLSDEQKIAILRGIKEGEALGNLWKPCYT